MKLEIRWNDSKLCVMSPAPKFCDVFRIEIVCFMVIHKNGYILKICCVI